MTLEDMLRQVCNNHFGPYGSWANPSFEGLFGIDQSVPCAIVTSLHPMPEEMDAVLACWREKMVAAIDEVMQRVKRDVEDIVRASQT